MCTHISCAALIILFRFQNVQSGNGITHSRKLRHKSTILRQLQSILWSFDLASDIQSPLSSHVIFLELGNSAETEGFP